MHFKLRQIFILIAITVFLSACGGPTIRMGISSSPDLNPNRKQSPLSVVVRIYQLRDISSFESTTFNEIWKNDLNALTGTVLTRKEIVIHPGVNTEIIFDRHEKAKYIGVAAIFRNPRDRKWRDIYELSSSLVGSRFSSSFSVSLVGNSINIAD